MSFQKHLSKWNDLKGSEEHRLNMSDTNYKILIGIPTIGTVQWQFAASMMGLETPRDTRVMWVPRVMIDTARNAMAQEVIDDPEITHLLMIDDDHVFDGNILFKLLNYNVDIIGALAFKRRPDFAPCVYKKNKKGDHYTILPKEFMEVDAIGSGFVLIKRKVFEDIEFPWFQTEYDDNFVHWSVDFDFCKKAKEAGFKIFCDPSISIKHIGDQPLIDEHNFQNYLKENNVIINDENNFISYGKRD